MDDVGGDIIVPCLCRSLICRQRSPQSAVAGRAAERTGQSVEIYNEYFIISHTAKCNYLNSLQSRYIIL